MTEAFSPSPARRKTILLLAILLLLSGSATLGISLHHWRRDADFREHARLVTGRVIGFRPPGLLSERQPRVEYTSPGNASDTALVEYPPKAGWSPDLGQSVQFFADPRRPHRGRFVPPGPEERHALPIGFNVLPILAGGVLLWILLRRPASQVQSWKTGA